MLLSLLLEANEVVDGGLEEQGVEAASIDQPLDDLRLGLKRAGLTVTGQLTQNHDLTVTDGVCDARHHRAQVSLLSPGRGGNEQQAEPGDEADQARLVTFRDRGA